jgi:hypothetical protein
VPTFDALARFLEEYGALTPQQKEAFRRMRRRFVHDLRTGHFRAGLNVHALHGHPGVFAIEWAPDGRATFHYGEPIHAGEPHIVWRRVGSHAIYDEP